jgi:hypothetical protein
MANPTRLKRTTRTLANIIFVCISVLLLIFLLRAPEETTSFLPKDDTHLPFHKIKSKKEAEKNCLDCHEQNGDAPLPEEHPPKFRCLFCHKRK